MSAAIELPDGSFLEIEDHILGLMWNFVQRRCWETEAGGLLIGRYIPSSSTFILDRATQPLPGDFRSRFRFFRRQRQHQAVLDEEWINSDQTRTYFGEWHTHPERVPRPSPTDLRSWRDKLLNPGMVVPKLFFLIVGQEKTGIWYGYCGGKTITEVAMIETGVGNGS